MNCFVMNNFPVTGSAKRIKKTSTKRELKNSHEPLSSYVSNWRQRQNEIIMRSCNRLAGWYRKITTEFHSKSLGEEKKIPFDTINIQTEFGIDALVSYGLCAHNIPVNPLNMLVSDRNFLAVNRFKEAPDVWPPMT